MEFSEWKEYFASNKNHFSAIDFDQPDHLTEAEKNLITSSLQQFQKGESSEGHHLYAFAKAFPDPDYVECIRLFIPEEQMHARVLARFMKTHGIPLIRGHWVDGVFRWLRKLAGIENTVAVLLVAETIAKVYYQALAAATGSRILKQVCNQILEDEEQHIRFQCDALHQLHKRRSVLGRMLNWVWQWMLMMGTILVVWHYHKRVLRTGGYYFGRFLLENMLIFSAADRYIRKGQERSGQVITT